MARSYLSESLISPGASEDDGCLEFIDRFERAYVPPGSACPPFHVGPLADAIKAAWGRPAAEVKLLVLYLHREGNALTKRFSRIFQSGIVGQLLTSYCVLWGWDVTSELNEKTLLRVVSNNLGYDNAWRLQTVGKMMYPCFIFLSRTHKKPGIELVQFLKASADLRFAVSLFSSAVVTFCSKIKPQLLAKEEKNKTGKGSEGVKPKRNETASEAQQSHARPKSPQDRKLAKGRAPVGADSDLKDDGESLQSLAEKVISKAVDISALFDSNSAQNPLNYPYHSQDEAARKRLTELKKQYLEAEHERLKAEKKAIYSRLLQEDSSKAGPSRKMEPKSEDRDWELRKKSKTRETSPAEHKLRSTRPSPKQKAESDVITLKFRSYEEVFEKKFKLDDTFEKLLLFLSSRGYSFREFKIIAGWPRADISEEDSRTPLKHLNFHMRDNVILERRRAAYPYNI